MSPLEALDPARHLLILNGDYLADFDNGGGVLSIRLPDADCLLLDADDKKKVKYGPRPHEFSFEQARETSADVSWWNVEVFEYKPVTLFTTNEPA